MSLLLTGGEKTAGKTNKIQFLYNSKCLKTVLFSIEIVYRSKYKRNFKAINAQSDRGSHRMSYNHMWGHRAQLAHQSLDGWVIQANMDVWSFSKNALKMAGKTDTIQFSHLKMQNRHFPLPLSPLRPHIWGT